jgi:hypothetical protein
VTAQTDVSLVAIGRDDFIEAVTGHPSSSAIADRVVGERGRGGS